MTHTNGLNRSSRAPSVVLLTWMGARSHSDNNPPPQHAKSRLGVGTKLGDFKTTFHLALARLLGMQVHGCTFHTRAPHGNTAFPVF